MEFPWVRIRRMVRTPALRRLVRSHRPSTDELLPTLRLPIEEPAAAAEGLAERAVEQGYLGIFLAPAVRRRDSEGSEVWRTDAPLAQALHAARATAPELAIFAELDLALFHRSGRVSVLTDGLADADTAHESIGKAGVTLGQAGADIIALRGQIDGGVTALREALDEADLDRVGILAFSGDLHSPFSELRPLSADKAADLLDPMDPGSILRQAEVDASEGADLLGVQPCLLAQDLLRELADEHQHPIVARISDHEAKMVEMAVRSGTGTLEEISGAVHSALIRSGARLVATPWAAAEVRP